MENEGEYMSPKRPTNAVMAPQFCGVQSDGDWTRAFTEVLGSSPVAKEYEE